jgi:hypothetical protein
MIDINVSNAIMWAAVVYNLLFSIAYIVYELQTKKCNFFIKFHGLVVWFVAFTFHLINQSIH